MKPKIKYPVSAGIGGASGFTGYAVTSIIKGNENIEVFEQVLNDLDYNLVEKEMIGNFLRPNAQFNYEGVMPSNVENGELINKINVNSVYVSTAVPGGIAAVSLLAIPFYAKKRPEIALIHAMTALGIQAGSIDALNRFNEIVMHNELSGQVKTLGEYLTNPVVSVTDPAQAGIYTGIIIGLDIVAAGALVGKIAYDYVKSKRAGIKSMTSGDFEKLEERTSY